MGRARPVVRLFLRKQWGIGTTFGPEAEPSVVARVRASRHTPARRASHKESMLKKA